MLRVGSRLQFSIDCLGKDLGGRYLFSKGLQEIRGSVVQVPGEGAVAAAGRGGARAGGRGCLGCSRKGRLQRDQQPGEALRRGLGVTRSMMGSHCKVLRRRPGM